MYPSEFESLLVETLAREATDTELQSLIKMHTRERLVRREGDALSGHVLDEMIDKGQFGEATHKARFPVSWLGFDSREIHQDVVAFQELVWSEAPTRIVLTGARDAGLVAMLASFLCLAGKSHRLLCVGSALSADVRDKLQRAAFGACIEFVDGDPLEQATFARVSVAVASHRTVIMIDSAFAGDKPWRELERYSPLVSVGSMLVVCGAGLGYGFEDVLAKTTLAGRNHATGAVTWFLATNENFVLDDSLAIKFHVSAQRGGLLRRLS